MVDFKKLGGVLLQAGAPILKGVVENAVGGIGGKMAGAVIEQLAAELGTKAEPDAIAEAIAKDPVRSAVVVQNVEAQFIKTMDIGVGDLGRYIGLLESDQKQEGIISRLWRPLFALVFTLSFGMDVVTACWLMWTRQLGTLTQLGELTTFLTFLFVAGCAVLGVQIWQRSEEKKTGA